MDWCVAGIELLYKIKSDRYKCSNSNVFVCSVIGKLYGRVQFKRIRDETECDIALRAEQRRFRMGRGCSVVRHVCVNFVPFGEFFFCHLCIWKRLIIKIPDCYVTNFENVWNWR